MARKVNKEILFPFDKKGNLQDYPLIGCSWLNNLIIKMFYPIQDDIWPSRRWNLSKTDYCDLSG